VLREEDWQDLLDMLAVSSLRADEMEKKVPSTPGPAAPGTTKTVTRYIAE